jgi:hypothetical protein
MTLHFITGIVLLVQLGTTSQSLHPYCIVNTYASIVLFSGSNLCQLVITNIALLNSEREMKGMTIPMSS